MIEEFKKLGNQKQREFTEKLTPCETPSLGIKIPQIKEFVKHITPSYELLDTIQLNEYLETDVLYSLILIKLGKTKDEQYQRYVNKFVDKVNNWMTCDTFVTNTKYKENELDSLYNYIKELLNTNACFKVRVGLVFLKKYFLKKLDFDEILNLLTPITYGEYYVDMGCAWLLCSMACIDFDWFYTHINDIKDLSEVVYKKTVQKIRDSYMITKEQKESLKHI